ncbi:raptor1B (ISS) [Corchorus olitorius]|uniref:Raptor1B (ISS) n=1 Tax=Corchorus olitorius TaxID=93759 RepID=A0A1R3KK81_9ROSI|nr:raptor1B (ISS) [Corchorus olitorius]
MHAIGRLWQLSDTSKLANPFKQAKDYKQDMKMKITMQPNDQSRMPHGSKGDVIQKTQDKRLEGHRGSDCKGWKSSKASKFEGVPTVKFPGEDLRGLSSRSQLKPEGSSKVEKKSLVRERHFDRGRRNELFKSPVSEETTPFPTGIFLLVLKI